MVLVRRMRENEAQAASDVMCACYQQIAPRYGYNDEQLQHLVGKRVAKATVEKESKSQLYLVACESEEIAGVVAVDGNEIARLFVKPGRQGKGIGGKLFDAAEDAVKKNGYEDITVQVLFPDAIGFYEKKGMKVFGKNVLSSGPFEGFEVQLMKKRL